MRVIKRRQMVLRPFESLSHESNDYVDDDGTGWLVGWLLGGRWFYDFKCIPKSNFKPDSVFVWVFV